jgi:hypothetical protein
MHPLLNSRAINTIYAFLPLKEKTCNGRLANIHLLMKLASVCKDWYAKVVCERDGPLKELKGKVAWPAKVDLSAFKTALRNLNITLGKEGEKVFAFIQHFPSQEACQGMDINIFDNESRTPLSRAMSRLLGDDGSEVPLWKFFMENKINANHLIENFPLIFSPSENEIKFWLADAFLKQLKQLDLAFSKRKFLQQKIHHISVKKREALHWLEKHEYIFTIDDMARWISHPAIETDTFEALFIRARYKIQQPLKTGEYLIHFVLSLYAGHPHKTAYIELLAKRGELHREDKDGYTPLCYYLQNSNQDLLNQAFDFFDAPLLWKQRDICHRAMINHTQALILKGEFDNDCARLQNVVSFLKAIKTKFASEKLFIEWLIGKDQGALLQAFALFAPELVGKLLQEKVISESHIPLCTESEFDMQKLLSNWHSPFILKFMEYSNKCNPGTEWQAYFHQVCLILETDLPYTDKEGNTPLHAFFSFTEYPNQYHPNTVTLINKLMDHGMDPHQPNKAGVTPYQIALRHPMWESVLPQLGEP